jgi:hypothetical protein
VLDDGRFGVLRVYLKYHEGKPVIRHLERVSRPGRRRFVGADEIPRVRNGLGMAILSTSTGILSDRTARSQGVGGELMASSGRNGEENDVAYRKIAGRPPEGSRGPSSNGSRLTVKGAKGTLDLDVHPDMAVVLEDGQIRVERPSDQKNHGRCTG